MTWIPGSLDGFTTSAAIGFAVALVVALVIVLLIADHERKEQS
jgi:hypothetical protein